VSLGGYRGTSPKWGRSRSPAGALFRPMGRLLYEHMFAQEPEAVATQELENEIVELAAHIYAATCRWLLLVAEFERRECHRAWGFHSTSAWISWTCGLTPRAARERVRVAKALRELPLTRATFSRGEISYSKVRALTRAASPATEERFLDLARFATASQLEQSVRAYRSARAVAAGEAVDPFVDWAWNDDGSLSFRGRLPADDGAIFLEALHRARELAWGERGRSAQRTGEPSPAPVNSADAFVTLCEAGLTSNGSSRGGDRYRVVVALGRDGKAALEQGSTLSEDATRRILCDAAMDTVDVADGRAGVAARTRTIPGAVRRAVDVRDDGCRFPGCTHRRYIDHHHIVHWVDGGEHAPSNLVSLCRRHHRLIHEGGFKVKRQPGGELVFGRPSGEVIQTRPPVTRGDAQAVAILASQAAAPPSGDPLDLDLTVDVLCQHAERVEPVEAAA
jgi:hypothetical protein